MKRYNIGKYTEYESDEDVINQIKTNIQEYEKNASFYQDGPIKDWHFNRASALEELLTIICNNSPQHTESENKHSQDSDS